MIKLSYYFYCVAKLPNLPILYLHHYAFEIKKIVKDKIHVRKQANEIRFVSLTNSGMLTTMLFLRESDSIFLKH